MSENILEWRRRWTPDFSVAPWLPFTIEGNHLLVKSLFTQTSFTVLVYDYTTMWIEQGNREVVLNTAKVCNPSVEAPLSELLQHLSDLLQEVKQSVKYNLEYKEKDRTKERLKIHLTSKLPQGVPFKWTLSLSKATDEMAASHLTNPLLILVSELMRREKELHRLIKKKDDEIEDYKMAGAKVSRKNKLTPVFEGKSFNQDMIGSKAFRTEIVNNGERAFIDQGQDLYKEVMITRAWLKRPLDAEEVSDDEIPDEDADPHNAAPAWVSRLPGSLVGDVSSDTLSPVKSSPSKSPMKPSPGESAQDNELRRREALEKRLAEEKAKLQTKKKKKKLF
ncbi:non-homologous end-joining factor 1-like [Lytechinus variegatus]|uniref:non-homologous end-joining factor 1-like n=1 Tax=Lytechinus variegatus TaxID=7654 RepID=UPI001BB14816|nr:non-homologous end-joining factor 1-like [Lytechinus variegatus]XP_041458380.1 non-homologous end-joining factor 1-like [Lytechinus variegatus]